MTLRREDAPEYQLLLRALKQGPMCARDIAIELGLVIRNAREYLKLVVENRDADIVKWEKGSRGPWYPIIELHQVGRVNVKSPPQQRIDDRRKADAERHANRRKDVENWLAERNRRRAKKVGALFVEAR